jgi:hypothetical protein
MKGGSKMEAMAEILYPENAVYQRSGLIKTTLYDLVEAVSDEMGSEDRQVVKKVVHILESGHARFLKCGLNIKST